MTIIPYHLDEGQEAMLSLQFVNEDEEVVQAKQVEERTSNDTPLVAYQSKIVELDKLNPTMYGLYEAELHPREVENLEERVEALTSEEQIFVTTVMDAFLQIEDEWSDEGKELRWYKQAEIWGILDILERVQFRQPVPFVGGELLSNFITRHPLPNANHRCAISLLETYLATYDPDFFMPKTGVTGHWKDWAQDFVYQSKQLMTLARKTPVLRRLQNCGCEGVERDGDNVIWFDEHDLSVDEYTRHYASELHLEESIAFVHGILDRTGNADLLNVEDDGKRAFSDRLSAQ